MGKSRNKNHSEVQFLRGRIKELEKELKYFRRQAREHEEIIDDVISDTEFELIGVNRCQKCRKGVVQVFDFIFAELHKCTTCDYEKKQKKS